MIKRVLTSVFCISIALGLSAQAPALVKDINTNASTGCQPGEVIKVGNKVFFRANDQLSTNPDFELWVTDATNAGTQKISINSGASGFPKNGKGLGASNEYFVFNGVGVGSGSELFIYNINSSTLGSVIDVYSGANSSDPDGFTQIPNTTNFVYAATDATGRRLFRSSLTSGGFTKVDNGLLNPSEFVALGANVYFTADDGSNGVELWRTNGSTVTLVKDINTSGSSNPENLTVVGNAIYFSADDGIKGTELWKTSENNGTPITVLVKNINTTAAAGSNPSQLTNVNGKLVFVADNGNSGSELFFSDGTIAGTKLKDINTSTSSSPTGLTSLGNLVFFAATQGGVGNELFYFNPISEVLTLAADVDGAATSSSPQYLTNAYGDLYFSANTAANGREVYKWSNGTTTRISDINANAASSNPLEFKVVNTDLVFFADNGTSGSELWKVALSNTPTITPISAKNIDENLTLSFTAFINSAYSTTANLTMTGSSSDTNLVGVNGFSFSGTGASRTVSITPKDYQNGTTTITLQVCDNSNNCVSSNFSFTVNSINNPPEISDVNQRDVNEDNSMVFSSLDFTGKFFDADGTSIDSLRIESLPKNGKLSLGTDTIENADLPRQFRFAIVGTLRYTPNANFNGKDTAVYNAHSSGDWAVNSKLIIVTVNSINDIPVITKNVRDTLSEDGSVALVPNKFLSAYSDIESSPMTNIKITFLPPNGVLLDGTDTLTFLNLPKTVLTANISNITYHPDTNYFGTDFILWRAFDGSANSVADTVFFRVNSVNDLPTSASINVSVNEDNTLSFNKNAFDAAYSDVETATISRVMVTSLPANGTLSINTTPITINQVFTRIQLDSFKFIPSLNFNGQTSFGIKVRDASEFSANSSLVNITVNPINDAPVADKVTFSATEDISFALNRAGFKTQITDIENDTLLNIQLTSLPSNGNIAFSGSNVATSQLPLTITGGLINQLVYTPNQDFNGVDVLKWKAYDGANFSVIADTIEINVAPVNDTPVVYNFNQTTDEDMSLTIFRKDFTDNFTDVDGDTIVYLSFTKLPRNGKMLVDGVEQTSTPFNVTLPNLDVLTYTPNANFNKKDTINFTGFDGGLNSSNTARVVFTVSPTNDTTIFTVPGQQNVLENTNSTIAGITLSDIDVDDGDVSVTLSVNNGFLTLNTTAFLSFQNGNGNADTAMTFTGSLARVNNALNNLIYKSKVEFLGLDFIYLNVSDPGPGTLATDNAEIQVLVNPRPVSFTVNPISQVTCEGNDVSYSVSVQGTAPFTYQWQLNGNDLTGKNQVSLTVPSIGVADTGSYTCKVTNAWGDSVSVEGNLEMYFKPQTDFSFSEACTSSPIQFSDSTTVIGDTVKNFSWAMGDGSAFTAKNPIHAYFSPNNYSVRLITTSGQGCLDTTFQNVLVTPTPVASFTSSVECEGDTTSFTNSSSALFGNLTYAWSFGNGDSSFSDDPKYLYDTLLNFQARLTAMNNNKCATTTSSFVTINPRPRVKFTSQTVCNGEMTNFTNQTTQRNGATNYNWSFGDSQTSNTISPSYLYITADTFNVELFAVSDKGCEDSLTKPTIVKPFPMVSFTSPNVCGVDSISFSNTSSISNRGFNSFWKFGDGSDSTLNGDFNFYYPSPGTYNVQLKVVADEGCVDSLSKDLVIYPMPNVAFNSTDICLGEVSSFSNSSTVISGSQTYRWNFGDNSISNNTSPTHLFATADTFYVQLLATTDKGCSDSLTKSFIAKPYPLVSFTAPNVCGVDSVNISNLTTTSKRGFTSYWQFGNGSNLTANGNFKYLYGAPGTYNLKLKVVADAGCSDSLIKAVTIYPMPNLSFSSPDICLGEISNFTNNSTILTGTQAYNWSFDDNTFSNSVSPNHTFATADTFNVEVFATTDKGCSDSLTQPIVVNPFPIVSFMAPNVCGVDSVNFANNTTITKRGFTSYWNFDNGSDSILNTDFNYYYNAPGTYNVQLKVIADEGCADSLSKDVTIYPMPNLSFSAPSICFGQTTNFNNGSSILSGVQSYVWDFDDGNSTNNVSPSNTYTTADTFNVKLTANTDKGCIDSLINPIIVRPFPVVGFSANNECDGDSIMFLNNTTISNGGFSSYWKFGNGIDTTVNGDHSYLYGAASLYSVELVITADAGCMDSITKTVTVYPVATINATSTDVACFGDPSGGITINPLGGTPPFQYSIDSGSTYSANNIFGNLFAGNYNLTTIDINGCNSDYLSNPMMVNEPTPLAFAIDSVFNVSCFEGSNGLIEGLATGGTSPYLYSIDSLNFQSSNIFSGLKTDSFRVVLRDANNCVTHQDTNITEPATPISLSFTYKNILCKDDSTGEISLTGIGSVGNYSYSIDGGNNMFSSGLFTQLGAGQYLMTVIDSNGCDTVQGINLTQPLTSVSMNLVSSTDVNCFGQNTGSLQVTANGGTGQLRYGINSKSNTSKAFVFSNLSANSYKVYSKDFNGCLDSLTVPINQPASALIIDSIASSDVLCFNTPSGNITLFGAGGTPGYMYKLDNGLVQMTNAFAVSKGATYNVEIIDSNNCVAMDTVKINEPSELLVNVVNITNENCEMQGNGSIEISAVGGTGPFQYSIDNNTYSNNNTLVNLINGNYMLYIKDANNCISSNNAIVNADTLLPVADFNHFRAGNTVSFNNQTLDANKLWWSFGDGDTSRLENPIHLYKAAAVYTVTLAAHNSCGQDTLVENIDVNSTGIDLDYLNVGISLYPNPATTMVQVSITNLVTESNTTLKIIDFLGKEIAIEVLPKQKEINKFLDISGLASGVYFLELSNNKQTITKKLIINK